MSFVCIGNVLQTGRSQTPPSRFTVSQRSPYVSRLAEEQRWYTSDAIEFSRVFQKELDSARDEGIEVARETRVRLRLFLEAFPERLPLPCPQVVGGGKVLLEWSKGPSRSLALMLGPTSKIHFASLVHGAAFNGNANFTGDQLPAEFFSLFRRWQRS